MSVGLCSSADPADIFSADGKLLTQLQRTDTIMVE
jgi:hypothetical protein